MEWYIAKPGEDRDPYRGLPRATHKAGAAVLGVHRRLFKRCEVCGGKVGLTKTRATVSMPKEDRLGVFVAEYVYMTWICAGCLGDYYRDGSGA